MSERISIAQLRAAGAAWVTETQLLALLDAVEAARDEQQNRRAAGQQTTARLADALANFDFGDAA